MKIAPYLNFVRSFEAAARHLSFTSAAEELNYTQSAISNHVRSLEEYIGRPLFVRYPRSLALTNLGEAYLPAIRNALAEIDTATEAIITTMHEKKVVVSCPVSLAQNWLTRVIAEFNAVHSDITVAIHGRIWRDEEAEIADIQLTSARIEDAPDGSEILWRDKLTVVCAPNFMVREQRLRSPEDLRHANLIHVMGRTDYWLKFAELFGWDDWKPTSGAQTNSLNVSLELAACGQGCVIVPKSLIGTYLDRGLLIEPFQFELESPWSCYISKEVRSGSKSTRLLRNWLLQYQD